MAASFALGACSPAEPGATPGADRSPGGLPETSVWQLDSTWRDQTGAECRLADFRGDVTIAAMGFTNCAYACPRLVADMLAIQRELGDRDGVRFLLVSFDTERDVPDVLRAWAEDRGMDSAWTLLHGDADAVRELSAVLGVRYKRTPEGDFSHSNIVFVIDRDGVVVQRMEGLNADAGPTVDTARALLDA